MSSNQAATLTPRQIDLVVEYIHANSDTPERDELMFALSHYAGLRVSEIAKLNLDTAMLDAEGRVPPMRSRPLIRIMSNVGKMKKAREIPMHQAVHDALRAFVKRHPDLNYIAFAPRKNMARMSVHNLTMWFWNTYKRAGLQNCSSHSGRRSFATRSARKLNQHGMHLRDLQLYLGHARLDTTQRYLEPSDGGHNLIGSL
ncbi:tyrosine-type recombinase [Citromicrobium phage vB_CbaS-RXM]|nr:tyrosine-type recombinase [Citromicrobium phage vB_CbaS-RXM]